MICSTPDCTNPRLKGRRICADCNRLHQNAQHRERWAAKYGQRRWPACHDCCHYQDCKGQRLWAKNAPLPCETLLDDEIGMEFETGELSLWVMPLSVKVRDYATTNAE